MSTRRLRGPLTTPRRALALALLLAAAGCQRTQPEAPRAAAAAVPAAPERTTPERTPEVREPPRGEPHPHVQPLAVCKDGGAPPLEAARAHYDAQHYAEALSCAARAAALEPDSADAHAERGLALAALEQDAEAQLAFARALALEPGNTNALWGAAHLYIVQLASSREHDELGLLYAERGLSESVKRPEQLADFALLAAMALNDLGRSAEALERAALVLAREPKDREAAYERALALFELCRFKEAKAAFTALLDDPERGAHAHHHLGLLLEREGKLKEAQAHLDRARALSPDEFPAPQLLGVPEFQAEVARAVAALPADMRKDLEGIPVTAEDVPADADLLSGEPPLSPTILGLFRGPPLDEPCDGSESPCRSVALYRKNLARAVTSRAELLEQIQVTLLHEVGHLRGEDDEELAARGLE
ncbi:hypothetical protein FGE12_10420 [Aggregicoccus sp. 17bor-14]|uniref:metallopeptidase family protein n=1 Tax=Myxococcaceae TaxID=31 RepID=UPI00129C6003|nr:MULTISPECIES: metallopeptidase family protein [Myxococcaceae]MBF5042807.1 metallopeptidase family protein [Simulacricoccus sp. 17bor-14]MRI88575.1 hypothetical protein [Aggregicoccus sp. 17bor-14]